MKRYIQKAYGRIIINRKSYAYTISMNDSERYYLRCSNTSEKMAPNMDKLFVKLLEMNEQAKKQFLDKKPIIIKL